MSKPDREPVCGEDFCGRCGDCLACYGGDPCYPNARWVEYDPADETGEHTIRNVLYPVHIPDTNSVKP